MSDCRCCKLYVVDELRYELEHTIYVSCQDGHLDWMMASHDCPFFEFDVDMII